MSFEINRPNKFLNTFINQIEGNGQLRILDVGCGTGDAALHLARLGHQSVGISNDDESIETAKKRAEYNRIRTCIFEAMDARDLKSEFEEGYFHAVLVSDMLHQMSKEDSNTTIESVKWLAAPLGYNTIRGYVIDPSKSTSDRNIERMFHPGELHETYLNDPNWRVITSTEEEFSPIFYDGKEHVSSHADVIARKQ